MALLNGSLFNGKLFSGALFSALDNEVVESEVAYHGGKGDNPVAYKPTGILHRKNKTVIEERLEIQQEVAQEASSQLSRIFDQDTQVIEMSLVEIDREIKYLMQKEFRSREEESLLVILIAANV